MAMLLEKGADVNATHKYACTYTFTYAYACTHQLAVFLGPLTHAQTAGVAAGAAQSACEGEEEGRRREEGE